MHQFKPVLMINGGMSRSVRHSVRPLEKPDWHPLFSINLSFYVIRERFLHSCDISPSAVRTFLAYSCDGAIYLTFD